MRRGQPTGQLTDRAYMAPGQRQTLNGRSEFLHTVIEAIGILFVSFFLPLIASCLAVSLGIFAALLHLSKLG